MNESKTPNTQKKLVGQGDSVSYRQSPKVFKAKVASIYPERFAIWSNHDSAWFDRLNARLETIVFDDSRIGIWKYTAITFQVDQLKTPEEAIEFMLNMTPGASQITYEEDGTLHFQYGADPETPATAGRGIDF